ncbi:MAG TPA: Holliday junction resolvase RuvX [Candidatus Krumholzibacteria bacterium]|nr:Holliday junction resolvase RuvX [Candidatus Krumholzibacteria bacterium]
MTGSGDRRRILAIDPGERRVGLAVSDPLGITAQGLPTLDRRRDGDVVGRVRALLAEYDVERIVVGYPLALSGRETEASRLASAMAEELRAAFGLPVDLWDERLSSAEAERTLRGARAEKGAVDRLAAVLILQGYLDARRPAQ